MSMAKQVTMRDNQTGHGQELELSNPIKHARTLSEEALTWDDARPLRFETDGSRPRVLTIAVYLGVSVRFESDGDCIIARNTGLSVNFLER